MKKIVGDSAKPRSAAPKEAELVAAGAALEHVRALGVEPGDVARATVDGTPVDIERAAAALQQAEARTLPQQGVVDRLVDRFDKAADKARPAMQKTAAGRALLRLFEADPETVARTGVVVLELKNGSSLPVPVKIVDSVASKWLQRTSMLVELVGIPVGLIPFLPNLASGGMAVASGLASLFADAIGRRDLAGALRGTAAKHTALCLTSVVPGLGELVAAYSLILDQSNLRRLAGPVTVADVVGL